MKIRSILAPYVIPNFKASLISIPYLQILFRAFLNLAMLITESEWVRLLRQVILDIVIYKGSALDVTDFTVSILDSSAFIRCPVCHKSYSCCMRSQSPGPLPANLPILSAISKEKGKERLFVK